MSKNLRRVFIVIGAVLLLIVAIGASLLLISRRAFPKTGGTLAVKGLQAPVEILRDSYGVPHIYAGNMHDMYFTEGFVHAQDRFWQMEFWRRIGSGRLSELFGKATLGTDMYLRTVGFRRIAEQEYAGMDAETRNILGAYADGVNAYILTRKPNRLGLEFSLLGLQGVKLEVEPWTPVNSLTWLKVMAQDLGGNMRKELYTIDLFHSLGLSLTRELFGSYRGGEMPYIVSDCELPAPLLKKQAQPPLASPERLAALSGIPTGLVGGFDPGASLVFGSGSGIGSNNWVISGSRTASGKPILANDPHLGIQMPSIWYEVDLNCSAQEAEMGKQAGGPFHVRGFSFAGTPGVVVGHNDRISWGVTNLGPDVQDLFIERINPENPSQYEVNGRWVDMKITKEEIRVKGKEEPVVLMARETRHGPIITDESGFPGYRGFAVNPAGQFPINLELKGLALRWTALRSNTTFRSVILLDQARTFTEFREALRSWDIPAQNFVYADKDGNIGYQSTGLIPIRKKGDGSIPAPGWTDEYEWAGFIPFDDMPYSYNPTKGYIVTANNAVTSGSYKYFIGTESDMGYRARRIVQMIETAKNNITVSDVERMQSDSLNISALEIIPYLKTLPLADVTAANARDILVQWDGRMDTGSAGAALFSYFWLALVEETFKDKIPQSLWNPDGVFDSNSRFMNTVYRILKDPQDPFWDRTATLDRRETRDDILQASLSKAVKLGTKAQGKDLRAWRWGREHTAVFRNQSFGKSGISLIERIFNRGPVPVSGGFQQVVSSDWKINAPFTVYAISSMRQIIDLGNLAGSLMMNATGQSGHPGNRHYDDMIDPWSKVRYHPTFWDRTALEKAGFQRLTLQPK